MIRVTSPPAYWRQRRFNKIPVPRFLAGRPTVMKAMMIALLASVATVAMAQDHVKFKVIDMPAEFSTITGRKIVTIKNNGDWKDYWNRYVTANIEDHGQWKPMPLPAVDFKLNEVVAVHMGTFSDA